MATAGVSRPERGSCPFYLAQITKKRQVLAGPNRDISDRRPVGSAVATTGIRRAQVLKKMSTTSTPATDLRTDDYDRMLATIDDAIEELSDKIENGRIRDPERDKVRLKQYRTLGYLIRTRRKVMQDATLQDLEAEIQELKADGDL